MSDSKPSQQAVEAATTYAEGSLRYYRRWPKRKLIPADGEMWLWHAYTHLRDVKEEEAATFIKELIQWAFLN